MAKSTPYVLSQKQLDRLAGAWAESLVSGSQWRQVHRGELEPDGRRYKPCLKAVLDGGYAIEGANNHLLATSKAYEALAEQKPDLVARWNKYGVMGLRWSMIPAAEIKWIVEHRDCYERWFVNPYSSGDPFEQGVSFPWTPEGKAKADEVGVKLSAATLIVASEEVRNVVREKLDGKYLTAFIEQNGRWGLEATGTLTHEEAQQVTFMATPFSEGHCLGSDPSKWGEKAKKFLERARKQLQEAVDFVNAAVKLNALDEAGWVKLNNKLVDAAVEMLKEQQAKEKKQG